jgi:hypothetical protein
MKWHDNHVLEHFAGEFRSCRAVGRFQNGTYFLPIESYAAKLQNRPTSLAEKPRGLFRI